MARSALAAVPAPEAPSIETLTSQHAAAEKILAEAQQAVSAAHKTFLSTGTDDARAALRAARELAQDRADDVDRAKHLLNEAVAEQNRRIERQARQEIQRLEDEIRSGGGDNELVSQIVAHLQEAQKLHEQRKQLAGENYQRRVRIRGLRASLGEDPPAPSTHEWRDAQPSWRPVINAIGDEIGGIFSRGVIQQ